jgi:hypothetical protein
LIATNRPIDLNIVGWSPRSRWIDLSWNALAEETTDPLSPGRWLDQGQEVLESSELFVAQLVEPSSLRTRE